MCSIHNQKKCSHLGEKSRLTNYTLQANYSGRRFVVFSAGADFAGLSDVLTLLESKCLTAWTRGFKVAVEPTKRLNCLHIISSDKYSESSLTVEPCGICEFSEQCRLSAS